MVNSPSSSRRSLSSCGPHHPYATRQQLQGPVTTATRRLRTRSHPISTKRNALRNVRKQDSALRPHTYNKNNSNDNTVQNGNVSDTSKRCQLRRRCVEDSRIGENHTEIKTSNGKTAQSKLSVIHGTHRNSNGCIRHTDGKQGVEVPLNFSGRNENGKTADGVSPAHRSNANTDTSSSHTLSCISNGNKTNPKPSIKKLLDPTAELESMESANTVKRRYSTRRRSSSHDDSTCKNDITVEAGPSQSNIIKPLFRYIKCRTCRVPCDENVIAKLKLLHSGCADEFDSTSPCLIQPVRDGNEEQVDDDSAITVLPSPDVDGDSYKKNFDRIKKTICSSFSIKLINEFSNFSTYVDEFEGKSDAEGVSESVSSPASNGCVRDGDNTQSDTGSLSVSPQLTDRDLNQSPYKDHDGMEEDSIFPKVTNLKDRNGNFIPYRDEHTLDGNLDYNNCHGESLSPGGDKCPVEISGETENALHTDVEECVHCKSSNEDDFSCKCCTASSTCVSKHIMENINPGMSSWVYYCTIHKHMHCRKHVRLKDDKLQQTSYHSHFLRNNREKNQFNCNYILHSTERLNLMHNHTFSTTAPTTNDTTLSKRCTNLMLADIDIDIGLFKEEDFRKHLQDELIRENNSSAHIKNYNREFTKSHSNAQVRNNNGNIRCDNAESNSDNKDTIRYNFICEWHHCSEQFVDNNKLLHHLKESHVDPMLENNDVFFCLWRKCKHINRPSSSHTWLTKHVLRHCSARPFRCMILGCDISFATQSGLARHVPTHFNEGKVRRTCVLTSSDQNQEADAKNADSVNSSSLENSEDESTEPVRKQSRCDKFAEHYKQVRSECTDEVGILQNIRKRLELSSPQHTANCQCGFTGPFTRIQHQIIGKRTCTDGSMDILLSPSSTKMFPLKSFWLDSDAVDVNEEDGEDSLAVDVETHKLSDDMKQLVYDNEQSFHLFRKQRDRKDFKL